MMLREALIAHEQEQTQTNEIQRRATKAYKENIQKDIFEENDDYDFES